jgi:hypothetical protein
MFACADKIPEKEYCCKPIMSGHYRFCWRSSQDFATLVAEDFQAKTVSLLFGL